MNDLFPSLAIGAGLLTVGTVLIRGHFAAWSTHRADTALTDDERAYYRRQFRRRVQVSALVILLGVMIPVGDALMQRKNPVFWTWYWIAILLIALWIMALAALDWLSFRTFHRALRANLASLARKRRELEDEIERLRRRGPNGRS